MNVNLYQRRIANGFEAVDLPSLDDKDVSRGTFEGLVVDRPHSPAFADELNLIVGMPVRPRTLARQPVEPKHGDAHVSLQGIVVAGL